MTLLVAFIVAQAPLHSIGRCGSMEAARDNVIEKGTSNDHGTTTHSPRTAHTRRGAGAAWSDRCQRVRANLGERNLQVYR